MCCAGMPTSHRLDHGCPTGFLNTRGLPNDPHARSTRAASTRETGRSIQVIAGDGRPPGSGADGNAFFFEQLLQFAGIEHLADDVAAADELALDVELRHCRP